MIKTTFKNSKEMNLMTTHAPNEYVGDCVICQTPLYRSENLTWVYHRSYGLVCKHHEGVMQWYTDLLNQELKGLDGVFFPSNEGESE